MKSWVRIPFPLLNQSINLFTNQKKQSIMGKTVFNPITTKWRGAIGGFRYSVVRGKQVIAERASAVKNPRTPGQMETRMKFKLASQFSNLWKDIIELNMVKKTRDLVMTRAAGTQVAFGASTLREGAAMVDLGDFANDFNAKNNQPVGAELVLTFNSTTQSITAPSGDIVTYKVVAFDNSNTPIGTNVTTYTSDGTAKNIDLPAIYGTAIRYDIMVFTITPSEGAEEYTGRLTEMLGQDNGGAAVADVYSLYAAMAAESLITVNGVLTDSYMA